METSGLAEKAESEFCAKRGVMPCDGSGVNCRIRALSAYAQPFNNSSIKTRLMIGLIPPVLIILIVTGYLTYFISSKFINSAIERSSQLQVMALNHEIEYFLDHCRQDLSNLAKENVNEDALRRFLSLNKLNGGLDYLGSCLYFAKNRRPPDLYGKRWVHRANTVGNDL